METVIQESPKDSLTCEECLAQVGDLEDLARRIDLEMDDDALLLPYFDSIFRVSKRGIVGPDFREAPLSVKLVLSKYLLMYPENVSAGLDWTPFREFPGSAPFTGYFRVHVEMILARMFTDRRIELMTSCAALGGFTPSDDMNYDASAIFQALPNMDLLLLFNDADETFPAKCLVLFEQNAHEFLDAESLSMVAWRMAFQIFNMSGFELPEE